MIRMEGMGGGRVFSANLVGAVFLSVTGSSLTAKGGCLEKKGWGKRMGLGRQYCSEPLGSVQDVLELMRTQLQLQDPHPKKTSLLVYTKKKMHGFLYTPIAWFQKAVLVYEKHTYAPIDGFAPNNLRPS